MIIAFLGDDFGRQLAEIYVINFYGFYPVSPRENLLEGLRCIFNFSDAQSLCVDTWKISKQSIESFGILKKKPA